MLEPQGWHLINAKLAASEQPAMSGNHIALAIDQDWDIKAKDTDDFSNLSDLFLAVTARVSRVRFKLGSRAEDDLQILLAGGYPGRFRSIVCIHIEYSYDWAWRLDDETLNPLHIRCYN
jgi:hypothetical protein